MDVIEEITNVVDKLNEIDEYGLSLNDKLSEVDKKLSDLLHYIENNKINMLWCYRIISKIKELRKERRKIKNDMKIYSKYVEQKNKLISIDNRKFLLTEVHKEEKLLGKEYKNKFYSESDIQKILKGV